MLEIMNDISRSFIYVKSLKSILYFSHSMLISIWTSICPTAQQTLMGPVAPGMDHIVL